MHLPLETNRLASSSAAVQMHPDKRALAIIAAAALTVKKVTIPARNSVVNVLRRSFSWKYLPTCATEMAQQQGTALQLHTQHRDTAAARTAAQRICADRG